MRDRRLSCSRNYRVLDAQEETSGQLEFGQQVGYSNKYQRHLYVLILFCYRVAAIASIRYDHGRVNAALLRETAVKLRVRLSCAERRLQMPVPHLDRPQSFDYHS